MKFIAKVLIEKHFEIEAQDLAGAAKATRVALRNLSSNSRLLGIAREGVSWDDDKPTFPVGAPPSGSPGTPTVTVDQPMTMAKAA